MIILDPGHRYLLDSLDGLARNELFFVKRTGARFPGNTTAYAGTTSQEVLRALIDRAQYVNAQIPCWQTRLSVWLMRAIIWLYEHRAAGVHGRRLPFFLRIEKESTCPKCGHIRCHEHG